MALTAFNETLDWFNISRNVIYSFLLMLNCLIGFIGLNTFQWIETTAEEMEEVGIALPPELPGLNTISCGLTTFCLDAAGNEVILSLLLTLSLSSWSYYIFCLRILLIPLLTGQAADCSFPWPRYNDEFSGVPMSMWRNAVFLILVGLVLEALCFVYSLLACFGCYSSFAQLWSTRLTTLSGVFLLAGILCWAGGFDEVAVNECLFYDDDDVCLSWAATFPSERANGLNGTIGCRVCPNIMKAFLPAASCRIGWGAILVVVSCIYALFAGCVGGEIKSRQKKNELNPKRRPRDQPFSF
eukprot:m.279718 g.279718  ORF g.279718 m.279718 type:complete len:298 (+) comp16323_c11_seq47:262-1155(+)